MSKLQASLSATAENRNSRGALAANQAATSTLTDTAYVLGVIVGSELPLEDLVEGLQARLEALRDPLSPEAATELQRQLVVLDSLVLRFAAEASRTRKGAAHQSLLLRACLQAQQGYARSFALLHTLALQRRGSAPPIALYDDGDEPTDP
jgi:hypothetical protein